jgi:cytochrome oxidase Cu insertion factor (SCO1/SenC/PrrC family)
MIRTPEALIPYIVALAAFLAGLAWHLADSIPHLGQTIVSGKIEVGGPFHLIDQDGAPREDRDFRGRWMMIYFGYTHCPDVCPLTLSLMSDVMQRLGGKSSHIVPIFITVDPARDTPKIMKAYVASFGKNFVGLTGDAKSIALAEREYRVAAIRHPLPGGDYAMDHSSTIYLMDPGGKFVMDYDDSTKPDDIAADIAKRL